MKNKLILFLIGIFDKKLAEQVKDILNKEILLYKPFPRPKPLLELVKEKVDFDKLYLNMKRAGKILGKQYNTYIDSLTTEEWLDHKPIRVSSEDFTTIEIECDYFYYRGIKFITEYYRPLPVKDNSKVILRGLKNGGYLGSEMLYSGHNFTPCEYIRGYVTDELKSPGMNIV